MTRAESLARAVVLELATNPQPGGTCCTVVGLTVDGDDLFWRVEPTDADAARARLDDQHDAYCDHLDTGPHRSAFRSRLADPTDKDLRLVVLDADAAHYLTQVEVQPDHGVAVLTLGDSPHARATIHIGTDGTATLQPLRLVFQAAGLHATVASDIAGLLHAADPDDPAVDEPASDPPKPHHSASSTTSETDDVDRVGLHNAESSPIEHEDEGDWQLPTPTHLVRVLGAPRVDGVTGLGRLELGIVTFLACNGGTATPDQVIDAVWGGKAIERGTFLDRLTKTRNAAPGLLLPRSNGTRDLSLAAGVTTDLRLLQLALEHAASVPSGQAIELLRTGLDLVNGVPFDEPTFDWAHDRQYHALACTLVEQASLRLVDLALDLGDINTARYAYRQGLKALPLNEPIYCARMRVEAAAGNTNGVREAYNELCRELANLDDYQPSNRTTALYEDLVRARRLRSTA